MRGCARPLRAVIVAAGCLVPLAAGMGLTQDAGRPPGSPAARTFETRVGPLLARHCVGCHGADVRQGGLDLSARAPALAGGASGKALVPGRPAESRLWRLVEAGTMPPSDRPRLTAAEKALLREWIAGGAVWSGPVLALPAAAAPRAPQWVQRLTVAEYIETVRAAVGVDVEADARRLLPPDVRADGFSNTAYNLAPDLRHVEAYSRLAEIIVGRLDVAAFAARHGGLPAPTDAGLRRFAATAGRRLLRGPLEEAEVAAYARLGGAVAATAGSAREAAAAILEAMLQAPRFVYRIERQRGDGRARRLSPHELAARLSYILWGAPPDDELARAADAGELVERPRVEAQVRRMLADPRAVHRSLQFAAEWLDLDRLANLRPNPARFPTWNARLAADMRAETLAFFEEVAWKQRRPLAELLTAQVTFATPRLAAHYGLPPDLSAGATRVGLLALYEFREGSGDTVRDTSGVSPALDLKVSAPTAVRWGPAGLTVAAPTLIAAPGPPARLVAAARRSGAFTVEAWVTPAQANQTGPARIITLSEGTGPRNFTLGQDGDRFDVRFRGTGTNTSGQPSVGSPTGTAGVRLTHVAYTREAGGRGRLFVDGEEQGLRDGGGTLANWSDTFRLVLANETTADRPWLGTFHRVALYDRALPPAEIQARGNTLTRYDLSAVPHRGGLLTHGSVLTVGGDQASMVARGLFVLHDLLSSKVGSAPPGVDTTPVPPKPGQSRRAVAEVRLANGACGGCHGKFEPLAFALEPFDGIGAYSEQDEHGNRQRQDGSILLPGAERPAAFRTAAELTALLAGSDRLRRTLTRKLTQFALGRPLTEADGPALDRIHAAAGQGGGTYQALLTAIVLSDLVQELPTEKTP